MPQDETLERFIGMVETGQHVQAIHDFYTEDASMQENMAPPRVGRDALMAHEARALARAQAVRSECVRPVMALGDHVVIRWVFEFTGHDGSVRRLEEIAWQRWEGERIAQEQFFYDPAQFVPRL